MTRARTLSIALPALLLVACSPGQDSNTGEQKDNLDSHGSVEREVATVNGEVRGSADVDSVIVYEVAADGSLTMLADDGVETESDDDYTQYTLDVFVDNGSYADLVVYAWGEDGEELGSVILSQELMADTTTTAGPIDAESSAEASLYLSLKAEGSWSATDSTALLRHVVDAELAGSLWSADEAEVETTGQAVLSAMTAWETMLTSEAVGGTWGDVDDVLSAMATAQNELDASLSSTPGDASDLLAEEVYAEAVSDAMFMAGFSTADAADAANASAEAGASYTSDLSVGVSGALTENMAHLRVDEILASTMASLEASGLTKSGMEAVADAALTLRAELDAAAAAGEDSEAAVTEAWADFTATVEATVRSEMSLITELAFSDTLDVISGLSSALSAELSTTSKVSATSTADGVVTAMSNYWLAIDAASQTDLLVNAGYDDTEARALVELMATLMIVSR